MLIYSNWKEIYTEDDSFRSERKKADLVYLIKKYAKRTDGKIPTKFELNKLKSIQLAVIWRNTKPFEFGLNLF